MVATDFKLTNKIKWSLKAKADEVVLIFSFYKELYLY